MRARKIAEGLGEAMVGGPRDTDAEPSMEEASQRRDLIPASLGGGERRARVRQERLAGRREPDRTLIAMTEGLPELALEATDLRADGRLGNRDAGSGPRELALLGHRHEVQEVSQVHNEIFWRRYSTCL
jgi:hypothetical protein